MTDPELHLMIEKAARGIASGTRFIDSQEHLALLQGYAENRVPGVTVVWGSRSCSEHTEDGMIIRIKTPSTQEASSDRERVHIAAQDLVHEIHHVLHSDHARLAEFEVSIRATAATRCINEEWLIDVYNTLEDSRLIANARMSEPRDVEYLEAVHRRGLERSIARYERELGESPWGATPKNAGEQLSLALNALILLNEEVSVTPVNKAALDEMRPHVDSARRGETDLATATIAIEAIVMGQQPT